MIPFNLNPACSFIHRAELQERRDQMVTFLRQRILEEVVQTSPCERKIYEIVKTTIESIEFNDVPPGTNNKSPKGTNNESHQEMNNNTPSDKEKKLISFRIWSGMISILEISFPMLEYFPENDPSTSTGLKYQSLYDDETLEDQIRRKTEFQAKLRAADKIGYLIATLNMLVVISIEYILPFFFEKMGYDEKTQKLFGHLIEEMGEALDLDTNYIHHSLSDFFRQKPLDHWLTAVERRAADIISEELKMPLLHKHIEYFPVFGLSTQQDLDLMILYLKFCSINPGPETLAKIKTRCQVLIRPIER